MKLVVGLGNPGEKYKNSRHNAGYLVVDQLKTRISNFQFPRPKATKFSNQLKIFKSDKFMNESGSCIDVLLHEYKVDLSNLYVIHDDLDIPLGSFKIQFGVGPKVHNGVNSVEEALGTKEFWRVRVGVDNRKSDDRTLGEDYVLQDFTNEERSILDKTIKEACKKLATSLTNTN